MWSFLISLIVLSNRTNIRFENNKNLPNLNNISKDFKKITLMKIQKEDMIVDFLIQQILMIKEMMSYS